jgi:putative transcriptional regulator
MQNRLAELRSKSRMTQEELAIKAGVSRQTIISLEKGKYNPSLQLAFKLARIFQMPVEEIFIMGDFCIIAKIKFFETTIWY